MKRRLLILVLSVSAIILELLPFGAVLNFGIPDVSGGHAYFRETYSYFDLMPFGYANFGPFLTAMMTCVLLVLSVVYLFAYKQGLKKVISVISGMALLFSLMPLMFGLNYFSVVGAAISVVLLGILLASLIPQRK